MITSIKLQGLRGIREGELRDFTPLVVLVGRNGCGKSTILDGLLIAANPLGAAIGISTVVHRHQGVEIGWPWLFWRRGNEPLVSTKIGVEAGMKWTRTCEIMRESSNNLSDYIVFCLSAFQSPGGKEIKKRERVLFRKNEPHQVLDSFALHLPGVAELALIEGPFSAIRSELHDLYSSAVNAGRRGEILSILMELVPGLVNIEILTEQDRPVLHLVFETHSVPVPLAGDGIYALILLVLEIAASKGGMALLEEPESHEHPGALRQTARVVWAAVRRGIQVFITTHSLELIDMLLNESKTDLAMYSLYHLRLDKGQLYSSRSSGDDIALARGKIQDDLR